MASDTTAPFDALADEPTDGSPRVRPRTVAFAGALALLTAGFAYAYVEPPIRALNAVYFLTDLSGLDWASLYATVLLGRLAAPLVADRERLRLYWRRLAGDPAGLLAFVGVVLFALVGTFGPFLTPPDPIVRPVASYQPPVFASTPEAVSFSCVGDVVDGMCTGTWRFPLGTTAEGNDMVNLLLAGGRTALQVAVVTAAVIVPLGVAVGATAGFLGGRVDEVLVGVTDAVSVVPPFVAYIVLAFVLARGAGDMLLLVAVFGSLGWAGIARAVRESVLSRREESYVTAAVNAGASRLYVLRQHLLPNVADTVAAAAAQQVAMLVLAEAALSYLGYGVVSIDSWGSLVATGTQGSLFGELLTTWWISTFPAVALVFAVVSLSVLGDALRNVLDPERGGA
ncbi:ABC transporter permease [Halosegnis marinus]|uniref:ABC transporter permease n=1 Tax=Halosegnis marinus TaxID=3034023 RepID=A0ABD5ZNP8_9EURY|nr:ABC transporter permease [Halosegnis sp. DT85]